MKLYIIVICFGVLTTFACVTAQTETVELKPYYPAKSGEKLWCALAGKTFCLNVTNYPSESVELHIGRAYIPLPYRNTLEEDSD